jgi:hypothetical protein
MQFELDQEAKELFVDYYNHCQRLRFDHPKQGMRAMLGKAAEKVGRVATILHCIHAAHFGSEVSQKIPAKQIAAAIKWVEYTTQQALSINIEVCSPNALESNLAKIISLAESKGGAVTARDVLLTFDSKYRPSGQTIREWFKELVELKYGEITEKGRSIRFSLDKTSTSSTLAHNLDTASLSNVDASIHITSTSSTLNGQNFKISKFNVDERGGNVEVFSTFSNPCPEKVSKDLTVNVEDVEVFASSAETTPPSMLSCTTDPAEFAEQIRKAISNFDRPLALEIEEALKDQAKAKLRNEVKDCLAPSETKNFNLLAKTEFLRGTRVKITSDYPGSETFRGAEATVKQDSGKGYFEVEFDAEIEVMGGKPKKILNVSSNYLTVVPSGKPEKKQHKEFEVADRVTITEHVAPTYKGAIGKITGKRFLGCTHIKYEVQLDKAVRGELSVAVEVPRHDGLTYLMPAPKTELPISF